MLETSGVILLYNNLFIYQVLCTLTSRRRSPYPFLSKIIDVLSLLHKPCYIAQVNCFYNVLFNVCLNVWCATIWGQPLDNEFMLWVANLLLVLCWQKPNKYSYIIHTDKQPSTYDTYRKTSNIRRVLVGNKIVDHSEVVGASPVGAAPTTSSFLTWHLASRDSAKKATRQYENLLSVGIWSSYIRDSTVTIKK